MKIKTLFTVIILTTLRSFAQSNVVDAHPKLGYVDFNTVFTNKYNEALANNQVKGCISSVTFAKFTIDTLGNIDKISFVDDQASPPFIRKLLREVILTSNGSWVPATVNNKKAESKPFILPLIYQLEAGCNIKTIENKTNDVLSRILVLNDSQIGEINQLTCVFLQPLVMFSVK